ncbi:aldo/keto reductase [Bisporella sp. PMI_857]|nr:aldo/keto reductase [Bisporella sp. PMI_857]
MPQLVGKEVGPIGYGLMGLTWREKPCPEEQAFEAMRAALRNGMNFWNGGEFYGTKEYNSLHLLERYFAKYPEDADKVVLSIKGVLDLETHSYDASPDGVRKSVDNCLKILNGRKKLDIFECARRDPNTPLQVTFDVLNKEYIQTGKLGGISLSEVNAATVHEAAKVTKIVACEVEFSLFSTDILTNGVAAACLEHSIPIIAYSPLGRGLLTGQIKTIDDVPPNLKRYPRYQPDAFPINLELVKQVEVIAKKKGCTPAQLAINWVIAASKKPGVPRVIPIPGATTAARVDENAKQIEVTDGEIAVLDSILAKFEVAGARYPDGIPMNT